MAQLGEGPGFGISGLGLGFVFLEVGFRGFRFSGFGPRVAMAHLHEGLLGEVVLV